MCQLSLGLQQRAKTHAHSHTLIQPARTLTHKHTLRDGDSNQACTPPPTHRALWCEQPAASRAAGTVFLFSSSSAPAAPKHHRYIQPKPPPCCPAPVPMSPWKHRNAHTHTQSRCSFSVFCFCFQIFNRIQLSIKKIKNKGEKTHRVVSQEDGEEREREGVKQLLFSPKYP